MASNEERDTGCDFGERLVTVLFNIVHYLIYIPGWFLQYYLTREEWPRLQNETVIQLKTKIVGGGGERSGRFQCAVGCSFDRKRPGMGQESGVAGHPRPSIE
jgi:inosine/xanthosine triphosphate pyrophosphatase family protein